MRKNFVTLPLLTSQPPGEYSHTRLACAIASSTVMGLLYSVTETCLEPKLRHDAYAWGLRVRVAIPPTFPNDEPTIVGLTFPKTLLGVDNVERCTDQLLIDAFTMDRDENLYILVKLPPLEGKYHDEIAVLRVHGDHENKPPAVCYVHQELGGQLYNYTKITIVRKARDEGPWLLIGDEEKPSRQILLRDPDVWRTVTTGAYTVTVHK